MKVGTMSRDEAGQPRFLPLRNGENAAKKRLRDAEVELNEAKLELQFIDLEATVEQFIAGTIQRARINAENERLFQLAHWHWKRGDKENADEYVAKTVSP